DKIIEKLTAGRTIFKIQSAEIAEGKSANVTLFTTENNWTFTKENILSKSKNTAFLGVKMKGKSIGIYNNGQLILSN
ncbi:MAG: dihydroorotase, partial [Flavobacterium sp.]